MRYTNMYAVWIADYGDDQGVRRTLIMDSIFKYELTISHIR